MKPLTTYHERVGVAKAAQIFGLSIEDARRLPTYERESDSVEVRWHLDRMEADAVAGGVKAETVFRERDDLVEALDLLALWYSRWQGFTAGTPERMQTRTAVLLHKHGRTPRGQARQEMVR